MAVRCIVCGAGWPCEIAVGGLVAAASCGAAADWASAKLSRYEDAALGAEKMAAFGHAIAGERHAVANGAADERFACEVAARCALDEPRGDGMERAGGGTIEVEEMGGLASTVSPVRHPRTARGLAAVPAQTPREAVAARHEVVRHPCRPPRETEEVVDEAEGSRPRRCKGSARGQPNAAQQKD